VIILEIKDPGHFLNIPGFKEIRTPIRMDVTKKDLTLILTYLRKMSITNYTLKTPSEDEEKIEQNKENIDLNKKMENIEGLLNKLLQKQPQLTQQIISVDNTVLTKKEKEVEVDNSFIPEIDISGLSTKGELTKTTVQSDSNSSIRESANLLKTLRKKSLKDYHG